MYMLAVLENVLYPAINFLSKLFMAHPVKHKLVLKGKKLSLY